MVSYKANFMYTVRYKGTIKNEIIHYLFTAKRGYVAKSHLIKVVNAILYKPKTGFQWKLLPVKPRLSCRLMTYNTAYRYYNK